ncbi:MAG: hypothetical protein L3J29_05430 [Cyclobacteriaceae bacterium]|nr:hypothetical protein [Cyclobacteriaceae bacterium]
MPLVYNTDLDTYLEKRNLFIHEFWRTHVSNNKYELEGTKAFLTNLSTQIEIWTKAFRGLLSFMGKSAFNNTEQEKRTIGAYNSLIKNEEFEIDFIKIFMLKGNVQHSMLDRALVVYS